MFLGNLEIYKCLKEILGSPNTVWKYFRRNGRLIFVLFVGDCLCENKKDWDILQPSIKSSPGGNVDKKEGFDDQLWYLELKFQLTC